jgi:hypothetical protein
VSDGLRITPEPTPAEAAAVRRALEAVGLLPAQPAGWAAPRPVPEPREPHR